VTVVLGALVHRPFPLVSARPVIPPSTTVRSRETHWRSQSPLRACRSRGEPTRFETRVRRSLRYWAAQKRCYAVAFSGLARKPSTNEIVSALGFVQPKIKARFGANARIVATRVAVDVLVSRPRVDGRVRGASRGEGLPGEGLDPEVTMATTLPEVLLASSCFAVCLVLVAVGVIASSPADIAGRSRCLCDGHTYCMSLASV
jgi:hypothetical protein